MEKKTISQKIILVILAVFAIVILFMLTGKKEVQPAPDGKPVNVLKLNVNNEPLEINLDDSETHYNCNTLNTEFDTVITLESKGHSVRINDKKPKNKKWTFKLDSIDKKTTLKLEVDGTEYTIDTLPEDFPVLVAQGEGCKDGYYYTTIGSFVVKYDTKGNLVFYKRDQAFCAGPFRRNETEDGVIYSYLRFNPSNEHAALKGIGYGQTALVLLDDKYQKIEEVPYLAATEKVPEEFPLENHEHLVLGKGHYILVSMIGRKVDNIPATLPGAEFGANIAACIFQEVKDGKCIFEWDSTEHPELYSASVESDDYTNTTLMWADYAHLNSVFIDPADNNFICSFRNLDCVMKISRETGDILWTLGGENDCFGITEDQQFHRQHNATITENGELLLFDNGNLVSISNFPAVPQEEKNKLSAQQRTRVLKFALDETNMEITDFEEFSVNGYTSTAMGSAQIIDPDTDSILVCWGQQGKPGMPVFQEVDFQNKKINFEMLCSDEKLNCYRVTYYDK